MALFWALCKQCKNNLLEVYFTETGMGARCSYCQATVFKLPDVNLATVQEAQEIEPLEDKVHPVIKEKKRDRIVH